MKKSFKIIILSLGVLLISSCTTAPLTGRPQLKFVSDEQAAAEFTQSYNKYISDLAARNLLANNTQDGIRLREIGGKISTAVENYMHQNGMSKKVRYLNWEYNLVKSEQVNAFALPGGKIAFNTAILPVLKTDAGIAFVMGHEIGHVIGGHHAEGKSRQTAAGVVMLGKGIADVLTGGATSVINNDLVEVGLTLGLLKFNRTQEYEADKYGMIFMAMAGYNPSEAIKAQERIMQLETGKSIELLSTHPDSANRLEAMKKFLPEAMKYYKK